MEYRFFTFNRAGNLDTNPTLFTQRAGVFSSSATIDGDAILLVRRTEHGMHSYLAATERAVESSAPLNLAQTVGARVEECEAPEGLESVEEVGYLEYRPSAAMRETQSGYDPAELPRVLAGTLPAGSWVALVLRAPKDRERRKWNPWLSHRMNTPAPVHHSMISNATVTNIWAGGSSRNEVSSILRQVTAAFPGFDLNTATVFPDRKAKSIRRISIATAVAAVAAIVPTVLQTQVGLVLPGLITPVLFALAALIGVPAILKLTGHLATDEAKLRNNLITARFPSPAIRAGRVRAPRRADTVTSHRRNSDGDKVPFTKNIPAHDGDYPLSANAFLLGPNVYAGLVSPNAGAVSGELVTRERATPPALLDAIGPYFGDVREGKAHLSAAAMLFGVAVVGKPGSGKAESLDARIPVPVSSRFPSGWALNRELEIGDSVFTPHGSTTPIVGFSDTFDGDMHEVVLDDGQRLKVDAGHLWEVTDRAALVAAHPTPGASKAATRLRAASDRVAPGVWATEDYLGFISGLSGTTLANIARGTGITPIEAANSGSLMVREKSLWPVREVLTRHADALDSLRPATRLLTTTELRANENAILLPAAFDGADVSLPADPYLLGTWVTNNLPATAATVAAGLPTPKRIPATYLRASATQRRAVLNGLMDTAGHTEGSLSTLTLGDELLAADAIELARSLGIRATQNGLRISFTATGAHDTLDIVDVVPVATEKVRCISVEAADGMYLTGGFVPTHNSVLVRAMYGWHCLERVTPSGLTGFPGARNALIAFESKGDGVAKYQSWAQATGDKLLVVDVADKNTPAIDLFSIPGDIHKKALFFTNAMQYTFGETAIAHRSFDTLVQVLTAGLAVTDELLEGIEERNERALGLGKSPLWYAYVLLGGHSDKDGVDLYNGIANAARKARDREEPNEDLTLAMDALSTLYDGKTESNRRTFQEAPRSKISQLLDLEDWWSPGRRKITWAQVLEGHRAIVINTGSSTSGIILDESQNQSISSLLMYSLKNAMVRHCSGWLEENRFVTIFADELALLSGSSPEIIGWIRDQGRSFGVRAVLATQRPEQLGPLLRNNFLTYSTLFSFTQNDVTTAREVAENMSAGNADWTVEDVLHTEPYHVIVRTEVDQRRQSAFTAKLPNFEADMAGYATAQGYRVAAETVTP